jgi:glycine/D-amino acid oxidase-like deaminating enzyme
MSGSYDRHVRIVIIGGGAIGCAVAYALTRRGERDVLLLEKSQITNGCTWHAAGLVGQLRGRKNLTRLMQNSVAVFDRLEAEAGQAIDWRKVGSHLEEINIREHEGRGEKGRRVIKIPSPLVGEGFLPRSCESEALGKSHGGKGEG